LEASKSREKRIYTVTIAGSIINVILLTLKFVVGFLGNSHAMIADAVHSLSDFVGDVILLVFIRIASKPRDGDHSYGHGKFETLSTAMIGMMLFAVGCAIFYDGAKLVWVYLDGETLYEPQLITLWVALVSVVLKEGLYWWTRYEGKITKSQALIANAWHHRSDSFSSIAVGLGIAGAIFLGEKWRVLDPLMAIFVSIFIIVISLKFIKNSVDELLEKSLSIQLCQNIMNTISSVDGFYDPHDLRTRRIGSGIAIEIHLRFDKNMTIEKAHDIATEVEERVKAEYGEGTHIVTHLEV
jgi:cation diffusion facilitator family transporter